MSRGRYKVGNEKGVWKYYYQFGTLARKEVYRWKRIKTTEYYENGTVERKGYAKLDEGAKGLHYYWYGAWKIYDREGKLVKVVNYEKGVIVQETALLETDP